MAIPVGTAVGYLTLDYSDFKKNLTSAVNESNSLSGKLSDTLGTGLTTIGDKLSAVGSALTMGVTLPLGLAAANTVSFSMDFDKAMSSVKAVTNATSEDFDAMRESAIRWGEKTVYTASEASQAMYYMGLAGWETKNILAGVGPILNLAAAGNLDLGRTSDIVTDAMTAMKIEAGELTDGIENTEFFTNVLAATMANSNTDVEKLGEGFKYITPLAGALNYDIRDLSLGLGLMANVGVKSSQAGTGLRQAFKNLIDPTEESQQAMDKYNVSLFDSEGKAKSMRTFMENLRSSFNGLEVDIYDVNGELKSGEQIMEEYGNSLPLSQQEKLQAIVQIFGTRALPGMLGIIEQSDEKFYALADSIDGAQAAFVEHEGTLMSLQEAYEKFGEQIYNDDSFQILGAGAGMAQTQMDNLWGDWTRFTSALGTAKIEITDIAKGALRELVQKLTELVQWFNNLDDEQQKNILKWVAFAAAAGPVLLVVGKMITGLGALFKAIYDIKKAIDLIKVGFTILKGAMAPAMGAISGMIGPILLVVAVIAVLVAAFVNLWKNNEDFRNRITQGWENLKNMFSEAGVKIQEALSKIGIDFESIGQLISTIWGGICEFLAPVFVAAWDIIVNTLGTVVNVIADLIQMLVGAFQFFFTGDITLWAEGFKNLLSDLLSFVTGILDSIGEFIYNLVATVAGWFGADWVLTWDEFKQCVGAVIGDVGEMLLGFLTMFWEGIILPILEGIDNLVTGIFNADQVIEKLVGDAATWLKTKFTEMWTNITNGFNEFRDNAATKFGEAKDNITKKLDEARENIRLWGINIVSTALSSFFEFLLNTKNKFEEVRQNITSKLDEAKSAISNWGSETKRKAEEAGRNFLDGVVNFVKQTPGKLRESFGQMLGALNELFWNMLAKGNDAGQGFTSSIQGALGSLPEWFSGLGQRIVDGIWSGLSGGWTWLSNQVSGLATKLLTSAKNVLGIKSPSRVFEKEFGYWIPLGAAEGVEDSMPKATKEIQKTFDKGLSSITGDVSVQSSLESMNNNVDEVFTNIINRFDVLKNQLIDIIKTFDMVINKMNVMGSKYEYSAAFSSGGSSNMFGGGIDYYALAQYVHQLMQDSPIQNNVNVMMQDGDVYLDSERVGRKVAPVVSRVQASNVRG